MRRRLAPKRILDELQRGNVQPLLDFHRTTFGDLRMEADGDGGDGADGNGSDDDDDDGDSSGGADGDNDDGEKDPRIKTLSDENAKHRNAAKALKQQNEELQAKLKKFEDADKGELEKLQGDHATVTAERDKLAEENQQLLIQNAFLMDNKHKWENPKAALRLADLSEVEIDDEGNVTGLREALDKLAKSDAYLLKKSSDDDDDDDDDKGKGGPVGQPVGGRQKQKGNPDREKLLSKYPALRR